MKKSATTKRNPFSADRREIKTGRTGGQDLSRVRALSQTADPEVVEEWK